MQIPGHRYEVAVIFDRVGVYVGEFMTCVDCHPPEQRRYVPGGVWLARYTGVPIQMYREMYCSYLGESEPGYHIYREPDN